MTHGIRFIPAGAGNTTAASGPAAPAAVYPRWRGEHPFTNPLIEENDGLSPLARGTRMFETNEIDNDRFIPAGAGNTASRGSGFQMTAVYPRWRGEHASRSSRLTPATGLSPLARGTHGQ